MDFTILAGDHTALVKCKMKACYDKKHNSLVDFPIGSIVSVRTRGLSSKFDDAWAGPYEILRKLTPVNLEIAILNSVQKKLIVHANMPKLWHTAET